MLIICTNCGFCRSAQPFKSTFKKMTPNCTECVKRKNRVVSRIAESDKVILVERRVLRKYSGILSIRSKT